MVLDAAKAAVRLSSMGRVDSQNVIDACNGTFCAPPADLPLVAVPTTPGTGAEVTPFATIWEVDGGRKLSLSGTGVAPSCSILDPTLLRSLSNKQLAAGLLDTLCQGSEAAWSARSTVESESYGLAAVALAGAAMSSLDSCQPDDTVRLTLQLAGHLSGQAIARATTSSCHSLSYPITLRTGLTHGHACGVTFGRMLRYNAEVTDADCADQRGVGRVRRVIANIVGLLGAADPADAELRVTRFLRGNKMATLDEIQCPLDALVRDALSYPRISDNPRSLTVKSLTDCLGTPPVEESRCK